MLQSLGLLFYTMNTEQVGKSDLGIFWWNREAMEGKYFAASSTFLRI